MTATALIGLQWGDEGKGKMIDCLAPDCDLVVRCQGGSNAGHTVIVGDESIVLHLVPSGILNPDVRCVIGNGVVVDPSQLLEEISTLEARGVEVAGRLTLSDRAHVVFPYHKRLDAAQETARGGRRIGTTGRGIGPAYQDKVARSGIRVGDLDDAARLRSRISGSLEDKASRLGRDAEGEDVLVDRALEVGRRLAPYVADTTTLVLDEHERGAKLLLEGAQGSLLDVDFGAYPYVTSSNCHVGGLLTGSGLPARALTRVLGVVKAYQTRVGEGPFPSELSDAVGERLRERGGEFGSTTGRPRRCGWLDTVALRFAVRSNGVDGLVLTKADVLEGFDEIGICVAYRIDGHETRDLPSDPGEVARAEPVYRMLPGWRDELASARTVDDFPATMREFVRVVEEECGAPVKWISTGAERSALVRIGAGA